MRPSDGQILELIKTCCHGRDKATTGAILADYIGCNVRDIQKGIESLRADGNPILSSDQGDAKGYYWPSSPQEAAEAEAGLKTMRRRAINTLRTISNIRKGLAREFEGNQCHLDLKETA